MADLLFGVETEYAISGLSPHGALGREEILHDLMRLATRQLIHLPDLHSGGGVFLQNGSRFYADCGLHPEFCTPECTSPLDAVRYIEAGHRILGQLASGVESAGQPGTEIVCSRCNVDYSGSQATWGCHESYLHRIPDEELQPAIIPHLVSRLIYTGAGGFNPLSHGLEFTLSPRMAYFQRVHTENSTSGRGIWHSKSEPLGSGFERLHVLCGESLCSETATFLKVGTTALIVALADAGLTPGSAVQLADPLAALQSVAADLGCKKPLKMADGSSLTAIQIQRHYLEEAESQLGLAFMPVWAAEVCQRWRKTLENLECDSASVDQTLDWGIKRALYADHSRRLGIEWDQLPFLNKVIEQMVSALDSRAGGEKNMTLENAIQKRRQMPRQIAEFKPLLQTRGFGWTDLRKLLNCRQQFFEIDTRFGELGNKSIFQNLDQAGVLDHRISAAHHVEEAMTEPPGNGRARVRANVIRRLTGTGKTQCDWQCVINFNDAQVLDLSDPFVKEEGPWLPLVSTEIQDEHVFHIRAGFQDPGGSSSPYSRRQEAADRILSGDFAGAETLLRGLLDERFMLPSTHCHMARVLLMTDREMEAREQINQAWAIRDQADTYVVPRMLFFQYVFAVLDEADITGVIGHLRTALSEPAATLDWTILPMLDHLRPRLGGKNYKFLKVLAKVLSGSEPLFGLEEFLQWRIAASQYST